MATFTMVQGSAFALLGALVATVSAGATVHAMPGYGMGAYAPASSIVRVVDRPEMRSFQPYSGLQYNFRPEPPPQRGVRRQRPEVVMPTPVSPLIIQGGVPDPYSAQWYVYCEQKYRSFEPGTGLYTTFSGARRMCR